MRSNRAVVLTVEMLLLVIIVAAVTLAVMYFLHHFTLGMANNYKPGLVVQQAQVVLVNPSNSFYEVNLWLDNTGSEPASVTSVDVYFNYGAYASYICSVAVTMQASNLVVNPGETVETSGYFSQSSSISSSEGYGCPSLPTSADTPLYIIVQYQVNGNTYQTGASATLQTLS